jgi:hypothetical protein
MNAMNEQIGGSHYKDFKIQPAQYSFANNLNWFQGEAIKYITRFKGKGGQKDLEKAIHVIQMLIELEYAKIT